VNANEIDAEFTAYPLPELADAALQRAAQLGAEHADFRAERTRGQQIGLSDGHLETQFDSDDLGLAVRVVVDGTWGFAAAVDLTTAAAAQAAAEAVDVARVAAAINSERIELAAEPAHGDVTWLSAYDVDPFAVSVGDKISLLGDWSAGLLAAAGVDHVDASLLQVKECKFYTDGATRRCSSGSGCTPRSPPCRSARTAGSRPCARWRRRPAAATST
jgi:TldD protein